MLQDDKRDRFCRVVACDARRSQFEARHVLDLKVFGLEVTNSAARWLKRLQLMSPFIMKFYKMMLNDALKSKANK